MSDLVGIVEEEEEPGRELTILNLQEITSASKVRSRLRKRHHHHKDKMLRRRMSGFEKRFSQLALDQTLVFEKKRIDFVLVHEKKSSKDAEDEDDRSKLERQELDRAKFQRLLIREGFTMQESMVNDVVYTKLFCPFKRLCREAEKVKFEMPIKDCPKLDPVTETRFSRFLDKYFETDDEADFISTEFLMNKIEKFEGHENPNTFFRPAVRSFLTHHILINLNIGCLDDDLNPREMTQEEKDSPQDKKGDDDDEETPLPVKRHGLPYMLMKGSYIDSFVLHDESAKSSVRGDNYLDDSRAGGEALEDDPRKSLDETWTRPFKFQPLWKIRNYFGERVAFYFAWSGMLCTTLWVPTIFGLCVFFYGLYVSATTDDGAVNNSTSIVDSFKDLFGDFKQSFDNDVTPYFGLVICVWGTIFLELWKRKNAELAYEWDVEQFEANEPDRPSFSGTRAKKDPVTDEFVWYYPFKRQFIKFILSFSVLIMMIFLVLISVIAIIMYRVIMDIDYCPDLNGTECLMVTTIMSSILNAVSILLLSRVYNVLARWLTEWENHRTQTRYDDALIFKLFAFQFVNSYASCFYIAFFRGRFDSVGFLDSDKYQDSCEGSCMTQLSFQILVLMVVKPLPKFCKDILLVWARKTWRKYPNCCKCLRRLTCCSATNQVADDDVENAEGGGKDRHRLTEHLHFLKHEHLKPTLGDFTLDEYTEKIIQYGFLMLFATSFPLAPLLALLTNLFDLRVDAKRLLWWYRRPIAFVAQDIGMWYQILLFVNFCGVVSNAFLIAFTSSWGAKYSTTGKLIIVIGFEHIVFALKYIVAYMIPDTPAHVSLSIRRERYQVQKKMEDTQKETDYATLFPVEPIDEIGEDGGDGRRSGKSGKSRHSSAKVEAKAVAKAETRAAANAEARSEGKQGTTVTYLYNQNAVEAPQSEPRSKTPRSPHTDADSQGGYVDLTDQERRRRMNPDGDMWYCGAQKSDSDGSASQLLKHSGKESGDQQAETSDLFASRNSRVSSSDVQPQGRQLWNTVDEIEMKEPANRDLHSPSYPVARDGNPNQKPQPQFGRSKTTC